jgi:hypothetical protein
VLCLSVVTMTTVATNWDNWGCITIIYTLHNLTESEKLMVEDPLYITPEIIGSCLQIYVTFYQSHGDLSVATRFIPVK